MIDFSKKPLFLAPMAGFTDLAFRSVVKKFGVDVTVSEMISSNALVYESKKTLKMLEKDEFEKPYIVQIAGSNKEVLKKAVLILNDFDFIDGIDFNCGCPVKKVIKQNAGSSLLRDLDELKSCLELIKKYNKKKSTSVKVRLGFDKENIVQIAKACEEAGVSYISIHARTAKQMYSGSADYEAIKRAKEAIKIPLVANGDINASNAKEVLDSTKADALMIGRASVGNPWIFYEIKNSKKVSKQLKKEIILSHFESMLRHHKELGLCMFKKHLHEYSKGYENASSFRQDINKSSDYKQSLRLVEDFFSQ